MHSDDPSEKIIQVLDNHPRGMNISALSQTLHCHRNSVSRYLNLLQLDGRVDLHYNGREKVYLCSHRIPYNTLKRISSHYLIGVDRDFNVADLNEPFMRLLNQPHKERLLAQNIQNMLFHPFHDPLVLQSIRAALNGEESSQIIEVNADGQVHRFVMKCVPTIFENKKTGAALTLREDLGKNELDEFIRLLEARYEMFSEDQEELVARFLPDGTITYANRAYCKVLGLSCDDVTGRKFRLIVPAEDRAAIQKHFDTLSEDHPVATIEHRCVLPDGSIRWHRWKDRVIFAGGKIVEYRSVGQDITGYKNKEESYVRIQDTLNERIAEKSEEWREINRELVSEIMKRERTENALKESESRYRAIVESQIELIVRWKPDGTITFVNDAACKYLGVPREALLGQNCLSFLTDEDKRRVKKLWSSFTPANPYGVIRHRTVLPSGETPWQEWAGGAIYDDEGNLVEYQSVGRDITDRIYAEISLEEHEKNYRSRLEGVNDVIVCLDARGYFTYLSPTVKQISGYDSDELMGKLAQSFFHNSDKGKGFEAFTKAFNGNPNTVECRVMNKSGSYKWMRAFCFPNIKKGQISGITAIIGETIDWRSETETLIKSYHSTLNALPDSILVINRAGKAAHYNRKFAELFLGQETITEVADSDAMVGFLSDQMTDGNEFLSKVKEFDGSPRPGNPATIKLKDGRAVELYCYPQVIDDQIMGTVLCFKSQT